jgi:protein-S-isoprenylcysteine O-methyltransferase Ste14
MLNKRPLKDIVILMLLILFASGNLMSQETGTDFYTNLGKMYVVVGVIVLIFLGLVYFLIRLGQRIKKLEKEIPTIKQ